MLLLCSKNYILLFDLSLCQSFLPLPFRHKWGLLAVILASKVQGARGKPASRLYSQGNNRPPAAEWKRQGGKGSTQQREQHKVEAEGTVAPKGETTDTHNSLSSGLLLAQCFPPLLAIQMEIISPVDDGDSDVRVYTRAPKPVFICCSSKRATYS